MLYDIKKFNSSQSKVFRLLYEDLDEAISLLTKYTESVTHKIMK